MQPIRVYSPDLTLLQETDNYQSLQFERSHFGVGEFEIHINMHLHGADAFEKGSLIVLDKQAHKAGIIMTKEVALDVSGKATENFMLTGYTLDGLMSRRITVPPVHTSHDRRQGNAELVLKHYVQNNFIDPVDPNRQMPMLEIAPVLNRGSQIKWESRYKNVAEELENIGQISNLGWTVYADIPRKKFVFDVVEGKDLTQENADGNHPVFFSPDFLTVESQNFVNSDQELRNVGYVGGQGEGVDRKIMELGKTSGIDRIEEFIDARDVGTDEEDEETGETTELTPEEIEEQLIERGINKMREMQTVLSFEAEILTPITRKSYERDEDNVREKTVQVTPFEYEVDFDLGDRVDAFNRSWGVTMKAPIVATREIHELGGYRLEATFGENRPTLLTKIQQKFDELSGIETQELPSKIEIHAKEYTDSMGNTTKLYSDHLDEIIRDNLNLDRELPEDVFMNSDGITGQANPEKYARLNHDGLLIQGGAIRIIRPDGAVAMDNGLLNNDFNISEYDPYLMDYGRVDSGAGLGSFKAFDDTFYDSWYTQQVGTLDGRGISDYNQDYDDIRDASKSYTVRFQRYEFIHSARYLKLTYQIASNNNVHQHRIMFDEVTSVPSGANPIQTLITYADGDRGTKDIVIDLGTPSYTARRFDFRIGWLRNGGVWGDKDSLIRFRIRRKSQSDIL